MLRFVLKRIGLAILSVWAVCTLTFFLAFLAPGDPAEIAAGQHSDAVVLAQVRHDYGLDQPPLTRYFRFLVGVVHGDLGRSYNSHEKVTDFLARALPNTAELALSAMVLALILGTVIGVAAASKPHSWLDRLLMSAVLLGVTLPTFVLAPILVIVFALKLHVLPVNGWGDFPSLVLPSVVLAARPAALIARMTRSSAIEVMRQDYIRTAKAKGLTSWKILTKHTLKNAFLPVLTTVGISFGFLLSGSFVVETAFTIPGVGYQSFQAFILRDYPLIQGTTLVLATGFVMVNLVVDLLYAVVDPRIRSANSTVA